MASKAPTLSDLIHRVTSSCLRHPLNSGHHLSDSDSDSDFHDGEDNSDEQEDEEEYLEPSPVQGGCRIKKEIEMMTLIGDVFETVSSMKKAYVSLQQAHSPWDADKIRSSDVAVVTELRKLGVLRERFRRTVGRLGNEIETRTVTAPTIREVVAPYEAAMEKLKTELKNKEIEVNNLIEKLKNTAAVNGGSGGRKSRSQRSHSHQSKRRVSCSSQFQSPLQSQSQTQSSLSTVGIVPPPSTAVPELFEACMNSVKEGSRSFASLLLSLMKSARWDITATIRSITGVNESIIGPNHAKYALESYVNRKLFQGFDHETFYMDGSLSSLLNPTQFRSESFMQYSDMKSMDPMELLGILPTCQFGKFCSKKYLSIVHPKMEESLFGDLEQRRQVLAGNHPRSRFYGEYLIVAKAVWMLHLVAFSIDPLPSHFEGSRGAEFHPEYMESAVRVGGGGGEGGYVVGFPVSPGFKFGNGYVVKARVYLVPKGEV